MTTTLTSAQIGLALMVSCRTLDLDRQAGVTILAGYNDGSLFKHDFIRKHLMEQDGGMYVRWRDLREAVDAKEPGMAYLSTTAERALRLALGLAIGAPVEDLGRALCGFDRSNAEVVLRAFALPLHMTVTVER